MIDISQILQFFQPFGTQTIIFLFIALTVGYIIGKLSKILVKLLVMAGIGVLISMILTQNPLVSFLQPYGKFLIIFGVGLILSLLK